MRKKSATLVHVFISALLAMLPACSPDDTTSTTGGNPAPVRPDPIVNEQMTHAETFADMPMPQEKSTLFRTTDTLADLDVRALERVGTTIYAGTASGVFRYDEATKVFQPVALPGTGAVIDLSILESNRLVVARADQVQVLTATGATGDVWSASLGIQCVAVRGTNVYVGTSTGLASIDGNGTTPIAAAQGFDARDLLVQGDIVWIATNGGIERYDAAAGAMLPRLTAPMHLVDDDVRALAWSNMELLAATKTGLSRIKMDGSSASIRKAGLGDLPTGDLRALSAQGDKILVGQAVGATGILMGQMNTEHWHSQRWLPSEEVTAVLATSDDSLWIGTHAGISHIVREPMTLADKAAVYESAVDLHWRMDGFVDDGISYADPWDHSTTPIHSDNDNDGLWTQIQIGAWCFAHATTKDEAYYEKAKKAMGVMKLLYEIPGETFAAKGMPRGFISRSIVRDDEGAIYEDKKTMTNWHEQVYQGRTYYWKDDTSSDEYVGHFFGTPIYYDLCAKTDEERKEIADRMHQVMSYIIDNGYVLIDLDGGGTKFGHWDNLATAVDGIAECLAQQKPNCAASYGGEGWLNSIAILGHLLATWHMTGDPKFYDEYERLAITERYGDMIMPTADTFTLTSKKNRNHSDHELAILSYYTLLRYEPNADRREKWLASLRKFYEYEQPERNTMEIGIMASAMPDGFVLADAVRTFGEWPLDQREWLYDNAHRVDVALDGVDRFDKPQFATVLPYDEIRTFKWNNNPYAVTAGGSGQRVQAPWPYLMPYWMMRYYGTLK